jgi:ABC-type proline/glycine betaine transport system permease subunit
MKWNSRIRCALVCLAFLVHLRSALVAVVSLPLGILAARRPATEGFILGVGEKSNDLPSS